MTLECQFRIGDEVSFKNAQRVMGYMLRSSDIGTVVGISKYEYFGSIILVDWGKDIGGHDCGGRCPMGHGWNAHEVDLEFAEQPSINVSVDDFV